MQCKIAILLIVTVIELPTCKL